jgi:hypothetical protein
MALRNLALIVSGGYSQHQVTASEKPEAHQCPQTYVQRTATLSRASRVPTAHPRVSAREITLGAGERSLALAADADAIVRVLDASVADISDPEPAA